MYLALDHPFDQLATVTVSPLPSPPAVLATVSYWLGDQVAFSVSSDNEESPLRLRVPSLTGPFAALKATLDYHWGHRTFERTGSTYGEPFDGRSVVVPLPETPTITAPHSGPSDDLRFAWVCPPAADMHFFLIGTEVQWNVRGPCSVSEFKPFQLPQAIPAKRMFSAGEYRVGIAALDLPEVVENGPLKSWYGTAQESVVLR
ncbi:MAG: hypothetical protein HY901_32900 [Deltaproteobacteria bacterium]|nr:hypothetical protein [Deltaproteobacteria bacterium]